jgi:hypothetical protein
MVIFHVTFAFQLVSSHFFHQRGLKLSVTFSQTWVDVDGAVKAIETEGCELANIT